MSTTPGNDDGSSGDASISFLDDFFESVLDVEDFDFDYEDSDALEELLAAVTPPECVGSDKSDADDGAEEPSTSEKAHQPEENAATASESRHRACGTLDTDSANELEEGEVLESNPTSPATTKKGASRERSESPEVIFLEEKRVSREERAKTGGAVARRRRKERHGVEQTEAEPAKGGGCQASEAELEVTVTPPSKAPVASPTVNVVDKASKKKKRRKRRSEKPSASTSESVNASEETTGKDEATPSSSFQSSLSASSSIVEQPPDGGQNVARKQLDLAQSSVALSVKPGGSCSNSKSRKRKSLPSPTEAAPDSSGCTHLDYSPPPGVTSPLPSPGVTSPLPPPGVTNSLPPQPPEKIARLPPVVSSELTDGIAQNTSAASVEQAAPSIVPVEKQIPLTSAVRTVLQLPPPPPVPIPPPPTRTRKSDDEWMTRIQGIVSEAGMSLQTPSTSKRLFEQRDPTPSSSNERQGLWNMNGTAFHGDLLDPSFLRRIVDVASGTSSTVITNSSASATTSTDTYSATASASFDRLARAAAERRSQRDAWKYLLLRDKQSFEFGGGSQLFAEFKRFGREDDLKGWLSSFAVLEPEVVEEDPTFHFCPIHQKPLELGDSLEDHMRFEHGLNRHEIQWVKCFNVTVKGRLANNAFIGHKKLSALFRKLDSSSSKAAVADFLVSIGHLLPGLDEFEDVKEEMAFPEGFLRTPTLPQAYSNILNLQMRQLDGTVQQYRADLGPVETIIAEVTTPPPQVPGTDAGPSAQPIRSSKFDVSPPKKARVVDSTPSPTLPAGTGPTIIRPLRDSRIASGPPVLHSAPSSSSSRQLIPQVANESGGGRPASDHRRSSPDPTSTRGQFGEISRLVPSPSTSSVKLEHADTGMTHYHASDMRPTVPLAAGRGPLDNGRSTSAVATSAVTQQASDMAPKKNKAKRTKPAVGRVLVSTLRKRTVSESSGSIDSDASDNDPDSRPTGSSTATMEDRRLAGSASRLVNGVAQSADSKETRRTMRRFYDGSHGRSL